MTCITDLANEIYSELDEPSDLSIPAIAFWLRSNIGQLNIKLCASYDIDATNNYEFTPDLSYSVKDIFKTMFYIYYFGKQITKNLSLAALNTTIEIDSDGSKVRKTSKNDTAKVYLEMKKLAQEDLKSMLNAYKYCRALPSAIAGADALYTSNSWVPLLRRNRCNCD